MQAWNGKWHILEDVVGVHAAEPVGGYNRVAKPERLQAMTRCGLGVYVKNEREINDRSDFTFITKGGFYRDSINMCKNCRAVIDHLYPKP